MNRRCCLAVVAFVSLGAGCDPEEAPAEQCGGVPASAPREARTDFPLSGDEVADLLDLSNPMPGSLTWADGDAPAVTVTQGQLPNEIEFSIFNGDTPPRDNCREGAELTFEVPLWVGTEDGSIDQVFVSTVTASVDATDRLTLRAHAKLRARDFLDTNWIAEQTPSQHQAVWFGLDLEWPQGSHGTDEAATGTVYIDGVRNCIKDPIDHPELCEGHFHEEVASLVLRR